MKQSKQIIKTIVGDKASEKDYRALLAVLLVLGLLFLLWKGDYHAAGVLGPLAGSAVGWYFGGRRRGS